VITKEQIIAANPVIKIGIDDEVKEVSSGADYDNFINLLFEDELAKEAKALDDAQAATEQEAAQAKLIALGLTEADLIAMGLMPKPVELVEPVEPA
jgi:hypothetical protein